MDARHKRRWLQFKLRTLLIVVTFAALSLGWWRHRHYCLARAEAHWWEEAFCLDREANHFKRRGLVPRPGTILVKTEEQLRLTRIAKQHHETSKAFRFAVWLPWLRWSINEPPCEIVWESRPSQ